MSAWPSAGRWLARAAIGLVWLASLAFPWPLSQDAYLAPFTTKPARLGMFDFHAVLDMPVCLVLLALNVVIVVVVFSMRGFGGKMRAAAVCIAVLTGVVAIGLSRPDPEADREWLWAQAAGWRRDATPALPGCHIAGPDGPARCGTSCSDPSQAFCELAFAGSRIFSFRQNNLTTCGVGVYRSAHARAGEALWATYIGALTGDEVAVKYMIADDGTQAVIALCFKPTAT